MVAEPARRVTPVRPITNDAEVSGKIALIQRGGCDFDVKVQHADDAGAVAALVYNIAGDPIVMNGTSGLSDIPALMIGQADGNLILAEIDDGNAGVGAAGKGAVADRVRGRQQDGRVLGARPGSGQ